MRLFGFCVQRIRRLVQHGQRRQQHKFAFRSNICSVLERPIGPRRVGGPQRARLALSRRRWRARAQDGGAEALVTGCHKVRQINLLECEQQLSLGLWRQGINHAAPKRPRRRLAQPRVRRAERRQLRQQWNHCNGRFHGSAGLRGAGAMGRKVHGC